MEWAKPTLRQWEQLYEVAERIKKLKPWDYLRENDIIVVQMPDKKEPYFCSVLGANHEMYAIVVYPDYASFVERNHTRDIPDLPYYIFAGRQNCLMCNFADREELSKEDYQVIRDLGLKFRGKNQWIYFNSFKTGCAPWMVDAGEADILIGALQNFYMALRGYLEGKLAVDFESGRILLRFYSEDKKLWLNCQTAMPKLPEFVPKRVAVNDELNLARLRAVRKTDKRIEMDLFYLPVAIREKKDEIPLYPHMCLVADEPSGIIIDQYLPDRGETEEDIMSSTLGGYILKFGRPESIRIRDEIAEGLIGDLCAKVGIAVQKSAVLDRIDTYVETLLNVRF